MVWILLTKSYLFLLQIQEGQSHVKQLYKHLYVLYFFSQDLIPCEMTDSLSVKAHNPLFAHYSVTYLYNVKVPHFL